MFVLAFCIDPDLDTVLGSVYGQPMAQIDYDAVGKIGTLGLMSLLFIVQFLAGSSILVVVSTELAGWWITVLGLLPTDLETIRIYSAESYLKGEFLSAILGLLCLIAPTAASALFSLTVAGKNLAWGTPIFWRVFVFPDNFVPGPFYIGSTLSAPIAWLAVVFLVFGIVLAMFLTCAAETMNYTMVINSAVWGGTLLYDFMDARKWFTRLKTTVEGKDLAMGQQAVFAVEKSNLGVSFDFPGERVGSSWGEE
ncbi:hypothetical protein LZ554_004435 [Drepanopeziza brunnea f. sp. 'monogermtubi']|nr:hypothetical protein LZ554_004435 [Drepanopeziza brunnea f. sp. 'monogermtubi']